MTDQEIKDVVADVLGGLAPDAGFERADVKFESDWDGDPIIRVRAFYARRPSAKPDPLLDAGYEIRSVLMQHGEDRFVFVTSDVATERALEPEEVD